MTQTTPEDVVIGECKADYTVESGIALDLLSLRAAVRRVHAAEDNYEKVAQSHVATSEVVCWSRDIVDVEKRKLRAEMGGIDKEGGA